MTALQSKKLLIVLNVLVFILLAIGGVFLYLQYQKNSQADLKPVHWHAGFKIIVGGVTQDFSGWEYMHLEQCSAAKSATAHVEDEDMIHLHDQIGDVAHVHYEGVTWQDLFTNIKYPILGDQKIVTIINGEIVENGLTQEVKNEDSIIVFIGENADISNISSIAVSKSRIAEVAQKSESCGTN